MNETIIAAAERNCKDVVPLYYPMAKAGAVQITPESKFNGMVAAWSGGNIGAISNAISKIWNSPEPDLDAVKVLVMENNFVIDYAKTLYKPTRPLEWDERIRTATTGLLPRFFIYAKDKTVQQVNAPSRSCVDRLSKMIQSYKFDFKKRQLGVFDYRLLMHNPDIIIDDHAQKLIAAYYKMVNNLRERQFGLGDERDTYIETIKEIRRTLKAFGDEQYVTDVLVAQLFGRRRTTHKSMFWECYGETVYQNLLNNHVDSKRMCLRCGMRFVPMYPNQCLCAVCARNGHYVPKVHPAAICVDCGKEFFPASLNVTRCSVCQWMVDNPPIPVASDRIGYCMACGAAFDINPRGRRSKLCRRCQEKNRKNRIRERVANLRSRYN